MIHLQLLLNSGLILIIATILSTGLPKDLSSYNLYELRNRLLAYHYPEHYDIELTLLNFENTSVNYFNFSGKCNITTQLTTQIHAFEINLGPSVNVFASSVVKKDQPEINIEHSLEKFSKELTSFQKLKCSTLLGPGTYIIRLEFNGTSCDDAEGLFRTSYMHYGKKRWLLATNFRPNTVQRVFPCYDEPAFRATFSISINCDEKYQVISNMALNNEKLSSSSSTHNHRNAVVNTTPRIYPNLVGFVVCDFLYNYTIIQEQKHIIHYRDLRLGIKFAKTVIENVTSHFKNDWQKLGKLVTTINYILIPGFPYEAKDNWGLVYLRETSVIYNRELDSFARKIEVARLLAQKVAHQMFGNLVSTSWWTDQWLNDGIAILFGINAVNKTFPNAQMWDLFVVRDLHESLHIDSIYPMKPLNQLEFDTAFDIDTSYRFFRYLKAPALLRMLQHLITDEVFRDGIHLYLKKYQYNTASVGDFWTAMETALENWNVNKSFDLKIVMDSWMMEYYPVVSVATNFKTNDDTNVTVSQNSIGKYYDKWWIYVTWFTNDLLVHSDHSVFGETWLSPDDETKVLTTIKSTDGWIIVNANRTGYYRVNYDVENWQRIAQFLNSPNYAKIPVLTRAQLIDDAFHLMVAGELKSELFWKLTKYYLRETDYIAWYPMIKALEYMSSIFPLSDKKVNDIKTHMVKILSKLLNKIGYDLKFNKDELSKCLIEEARKWACILGDPLCKDYATQKLQWHLQDRRTNKLLPWWKEWTYCKGLMAADSMIWYGVVNIWNKERDHTILQHLMCSEDYYIIFQSMALMTHNNFINIQANERVYYFLFLLSRHSNDRSLLEDILDQFSDIKPNEITEIAAINIIINHIHSKKQLQKVKEFVSNKSPDLKLNVYLKIEKRIVQINKRMKYLEIVSM